MEEFDLVIIGAGSAGCVAANIFSKDRNLKILILEAGPTNLNPIIKIKGHYEIQENTNPSIYTIF